MLSRFAHTRKNFSPQHNRESQAGSWFETIKHTRLCLFSFHLFIYIYLDNVKSWSSHRLNRINQTTTNCRTTRNFNPHSLLGLAYKLADFFVLLALETKKSHTRLEILICIFPSHRMRVSARKPTEEKKTIFDCLILRFRRNQSVSERFAGFEGDFFNWGSGWLDDYGVERKIVVIAGRD